MPSSKSNKDKGKAAPSLTEHVDSDPDEVASVGNTGDDLKSQLTAGTTMSQSTTTTSFLSSDSTVSIISAPLLRPAAAADSCLLELP